MGFALSVVSTEENFRKYNAIEAFLSDVETRNIKPINVEMQWSVSIRFPEEDLASKQVIKIVITRPAYEIMGDDHVDAHLLLVYKNQPIVGNGAIIISIENTNKIWALDIMSHIENWLSKNVKKPSIDEKVKRSYASRNRTRMLSRVMIEILPYILGAGISLRLLVHAKSVTLTDSMLYFVFLCVSLLFAYQFVTRKYAGYLSDSIAKKFGGLMPRSVFIFSKEDQEKYEEYKASLILNRRAALREIGLAFFVNITSSILFVIFIETALRKAIGI